MQEGNDDFENGAFIPWIDDGKKDYIEMIGKTLSSSPLLLKHVRECEKSSREDTSVE